MIGKRLYKVLLICVVVTMLTMSLVSCAPAAQPDNTADKEAVAEEPAVKEEEAEEPAESEEVEEEVVTITFWHIYTEAMAGANSWFVDMVDQFEAENPNIKVQMETFGSDAYKTKLPAALSAGEAADAIMVNPGMQMLPQVESAYYEPLDKALDEDGWREEFASGTFDSVSFDRKAYAIPFTLRTVHVWYNKDVFDKYNLVPPKTFDELVAIADTLKANGVTPFALGSKMTWQADMYVNFLIERIGGYDVWAAARDNEGLGWEDPAIIEAFRVFQDMVAKGYFSEGTLGLDPMDVNQSFFDGTSAMIVNGTFFPDQVKSLGPEGFLENNLGYFNFPMIEGGKGNPNVQQGGVGSAFAVNAKSKNIEEVIKFYKFLFTSEHMTDASSRTNYVTCMKNSIPSNANTLLTALAKEVETMENYIWYINNALAPEPYIVFQATMQELMDQSITPEEAATKIQEAMN